MGKPKAVVGEMNYEKEARELLGGQSDKHHVPVEGLKVEEQLKSIVYALTLAHQAGRKEGYKRGIEEAEKVVKSFGKNSIYAPAILQAIRNLDKERK